MPPKKSNTLTEAELRLMKILWRRGESAVTDLVAAMPEGEPLAYNSVLTTIRILEQKGYVEHRQEGRAFVYRPCVAEQEASRSEVRHVLSRFFGNSRERLLLSLLGDEELTLDELARLKDAIRQAEPEGAGGRQRRKVRRNAWRWQRLVRAFADAAGPLAISALWQGAALALALALCLRLTPRIAAADRFRVWAAGFAALVALPFLPALLCLLPFRF